MLWIDVSGQQNADIWEADNGIIPAEADENVSKNKAITQSALSDILSNYEAADLPKVGVVADGLI